MKEDKRIGVQGEGSKTPEADVQKTTREDPNWPGDYLSHDELRALFSGQERNITAQAEALKAARGRMADLEDALREANDQIEKRREAHRRAALDYFDLVSKLPQDANGAYLALDDIVEYEGERWQVVAISHKRKIVIRRESATDGKGGKWLDDARLVTFAEGGPQNHEAIVSKLRAAGFVPVSEAVGKCPACEHEAESRPESAPDSTLWEDSEFWRQQYGNSQMEVMRLNTELSDALTERDNARDMAVGLENEVASLQAEREVEQDENAALSESHRRLRAENEDLKSSLHAAEGVRNRALNAWDTILTRAEAASYLVGTIGNNLSPNATGAIAALCCIADIIDAAVATSRRIMGARDAFDFTHKEVEDGQE